jgi:hypothetical protein
VRRKSRQRIGRQHRSNLQRGSLDTFSFIVLKCGVSSMYRVEKKCASLTDWDSDCDRCKESDEIVELHADRGLGVDGEVEIWMIECSCS